ncbi:hypothetical protein NPX13_g4550 [Xylaria arbuscula]|uniref:VWFA domain-containing protein n=1 Tax=Xylaria arbuscula TaxID=114810 RepID=A0A9W8NGA6_9PEZI|nr:hypothetical protein NPX13_g4550 [Xylaria arbuscula]
MKAELSVSTDTGSESPSSPPTPSSTDEPIVTIHPLESREGVLVTVQPPERPSIPLLGHVPCDIVLVLDVSSSMNADAPAAVYDEQGNAAKEHFGLTVLDLTKHAARTVVSALNEGDRLGIVTFGYSSCVVQELTTMTEMNKTLVNKRIDSMVADGATNLWEGIKDGLKLLESESPSCRVPALMVLTDGQPNHMCPSKGYARELRAMGTLPASINTFGFGYEIRSGLLKSIAETCHGNYAFIPDAGMIGTVFVHAVARLMSTHATRCTLEITVPKTVLLQTSAAETDTNQSCEDGEKQRDYNKLTIHLGNLQYGQSRDIYLKSHDGGSEKRAYEVSGKDRMMHATLTYTRMGSAEYVTFADQDMLEFSPLPRSVIAYHQSHAILCDLLASFTSSWSPEDVDKHLDSINDEQSRLQNAIYTIPARDYKDKYNQSLIQDLNGQVSEALSREAYFNRWGRHFFFSLRNAHEKQL